MPFRPNRVSFLHHSLFELFLWMFPAVLTLVIEWWRSGPASSLYFVGVGSGLAAVMVRGVFRSRDSGDFAFRSGVFAYRIVQYFWILLLFPISSPWWLAPVVAALPLLVVSPFETGSIPFLHPLLSLLLFLSVFLLGIPVSCPLSLPPAIGCFASVIHPEFVVAIVSVFLVLKPERFAPLLIPVVLVSVTALTFLDWNRAYRLIGFFVALFFFPGRPVARLSYWLVYSLFFIGGSAFLGLYFVMGVSLEDTLHDFDAGWILRGRTGHGIRPGPLDEVEGKLDYSLSF